MRDLGFYADSDLSMRTHVLRTAGRCFAALRQIRSIRRSVTRPVLESLVVVLVLASARLWLRYTCRRAKSAARQTPVSTECCSSTDLWCQLPCPYHAAPSQPSLVAGTWADRIQASGTCLPLPSWNSACLFVSWSAMRVWHWITVATSLCDDLCACRPSHSTCHDWRSCLCHCRTGCLEQSTWGCAVVDITASVSASAEDRALQTLTRP